MEYNKELITALIAVGKKLPIIKRDTKAYNYKYSPLDKIWDKVGNIIMDAGFVVTNEITEAGVRTIAAHEHGVLSSFCEFSDGLKPQDRGSEITYYRRYNLTAIFNIQLEDEDDDGKKANNASSGVGRPAKVQPSNLGKCPKCGADMKLSQKGTTYCSAKCWLDHPTATSQGPADRNKRISDELDNIPVIDSVTGKVIG